MIIKFQASSSLCNMSGDIDKPKAKEKEKNVIEFEWRM